MNRLSDQRLFGSHTLYDALQQLLGSVNVRVQRIAESVLRVCDVSELADQLMEDLRVEPITLDRARQSMTREETEIDVTGDPLRIGYFDGRKLIVPGIRILVSIPFHGSSWLWRVVPSTFRLSNPVGLVHSGPNESGGVLMVPIEQPADRPLEGIKAELDRRMDDILFNIDSQRRDLLNFESELRRVIQDEITKRKSRLTKHDDLASLLGIPEMVPVTERQATIVPVKNVPNPSWAKPTTSGKWDAFVSHASEDKDTFVRPLVQALADRGVRVWYDEGSLRVGDSLRQSIDLGLSRSRYGIVVLSNAFLAKRWPLRELDGLIAREEDGVKVVLPIWHNITAREVRDVSPTLADRLALTSSRGVGYVANELSSVILEARN